MATAESGSVVRALDEPVIHLRGVGPERGMQLSRLEIHTVRDLLLHRPLRYEDRRHLISIAELAAGKPATVKGKIVAQGIKWARKRTKSIFEFIITDGTARLYCRWWNLPFMEKFFSVDDEVIVFGKPVSLKPRTMDHPETEVIDAGDEDFVHFNRITPVYPLTEGLAQRWLRSLIWRTLEQMDLPAQLATGSITAGDPSIVSYARAVRMLHFPETDADAKAAVRRLALEEFIQLQRGIQSRRRNLEKNAEALPCGGNNRLMRPFLAALGFKLTAAQTIVLRTLRQDLSAVHPMRRLLQGDVGSGKTVVAACCALMTLESGYNAALMAPTEILAEQHYQNFKKWLAPLGIAVEIRTGSRKSDGASSAAGQARASTGATQPTFHVGTHALIQKQFAPENLGLVIIDEQHRFGVEQREEFLRKGRYPHLLVMTATPIPRTLGLTVYGDLDVSVIDALPPGRGRIKTFVRTSDRLPKVWEFIRAQLAKGRQAYVVYPRVEDSGTAGVKAVTTERANLDRIFNGYRVGLVYGKLSSDEKEVVMAEFRSGRIHVLLATSLIEVGVDVANATVMLIENAEQFGLAQLHQLRGRVGRGAHESYCILLANAKTDEARARLRILEQTDDGFRISEEDLKIRGPGELLGQKQSGLPRFRFGNLVEDRELIEEARTLAKTVPGAAQ